MGYKIEWTGGARRALRRIRRDMQATILEAVEGLSENPRPQGIFPLKGRMEGHYRLRVGIHYRIVYRVDDAVRIVLIVAVGSREDIY